MFSRQPLLFCAFFAAVGALVGIYAQARLPATYLFALPLPLLLLAALLLGRGRRTGWAALCLLLAVADMGLLLGRIAVPAWYGQWGENRNYTWVEGRVVARRHGSNGDSLVLDHLVAQADEQIYALEGKLCLTLLEQPEDTASGASSAANSSNFLGLTAEEVRVGDRMSLEGCTLRLPEVSLLPGSFDSRLYYATQGIRFTATVAGTAARRQPGHGLGRLLDSLRLAVYHRLTETMGEAGAGLLNALLLGWTADISAQREAYANLGIAHVLAVSGLHVSLLIAAVNFLANRLNWPRMPRHLLRGLLILAYFLLAGSRPAFLRVLFMALFSLLAEETQQEYDAVNALGAAWLLQLLMDPLSVATAACQLTYLATAALLLFLEEMKGHRRLGSLVLPLLIAWAVLPASGNALYPALTSLANLILVPLHTILLGAGFLYLPLAFLPAVGPFLGGVLGSFSHVLSMLVTFLGNTLPALRLPYHQGWLLCLVSSLLLLLSSRRLLGRKRLLRASCLVGAALALAGSVLPGTRQQSALVEALGNGSVAALLLPGLEENILVASQVPYGTDAALETTVRGRADVFFYTGKEPLALEYALYALPGVKTAYLSEARYREDADWYAQFSAYSGIAIRGLAEGAVYQAGPYSLSFREDGNLAVSTPGSQLTYGETLPEAGVHVAAYGSVVRYSHASPALRLIYSLPYVSAGLDERVQNGYNIAKDGPCAWEIEEETPCR